jgi:hypothetical protein
MKNAKLLFKVLPVGACLCLLMACAFTDSTNVATSGIYMGYVVEHHSDSHIEIRAYPRVGGPLGTIITLSSGERITCNGTTLSKGILHYYTTFTSPAAGDTYTFTFHRVDETLNTVIIVPASPDTAAVSPSTNYNEWDPLDVSWNTSGSLAGDDIRIDISGSSINSYSRLNLTDNGSYTVNDPPGTGLTSPDNAAAGPITVHVKRCRYGTINPEYQGGHIRGERWSQGVTIPNFQPRLTMAVTIAPVASGWVTTEGSVSGSSSSGEYRRFIMNETVTLTAVPQTGWNFTGWSGDLSGIVNPETIASITGNMDVTATFGP